MNTCVFLEPLDLLLLRGNKLFGDPGSHGESLVPPWPSVAAGALRSRMLVDEGIAPERYARHDSDPHPVLGRPDAPGPFRLRHFGLARRHPHGRVERLYPLPADLVPGHGEDGTLRIGRLRPQTPPSGLDSGYPLPELPVLQQAERRKAESGYWLAESGWRRYLAGETPEPGDLVASGQLWGFDARVGIGLDPATGRPDTGRLFTVQGVAMRPGVGFVAEASGATLPASGLLRFGGDGRAVRIHPEQPTAIEPDYDALAAAQGCRIVLTAPGVFRGGWRPNGCGAARPDGALDFDLHGVRGRLSCAAVARAETVSGWDLARRAPKPAQRFAPAGSVYWLKLDPGCTAEVLCKLAEHGLWSEPCEDPVRRAEGFNTLALAPY